MTFARHTCLSIYVLTTLYPFSEGIHTRLAKLIALTLAVLVIGSTAVVSAASKTNTELMYQGTWRMSTDTNAALEAITPATQLTALYAEYDGLLDALEEVQRKLASTSRLNPLTRSKLRKQRNDLCEILADVHEKIADFDFVLM